MLATRSTRPRRLWSDTLAGGLGQRAAATAHITRPSQSHCAVSPRARPMRASIIDGATGLGQCGGSGSREETEVIGTPTARTAVRIVLTLRRVCPRVFQWRSPACVQTVLST